MNAVMALNEDILSRDSINDSRAQNPLSADAIIWIGDLNYRINGTIGAVLFTIKRNMYEVLLDNDQLNIERKIGRLGDHMQEGPIHFAPTYKLKQGTDMYNASARIPSWTDRVLFASRSDYLTQKSYDSNNLLKHSDHRPVFSQFELRYEFLEGFATLNNSMMSKLENDPNGKGDVSE